MLGSWTGLLAPRAVAPASTSSADEEAPDAAPCCSSGSPFAARAWFIQERATDVLLQHVCLAVDGDGVLRLTAATASSAGGEPPVLASLHLGGLQVLDVDGEGGEGGAGEGEAAGPRPSSPPVVLPEPPRPPSTLRRLLFAPSQQRAAAVPPAKRRALSRLVLKRPGSDEALLTLAADTEADHRRLAAGLAAAAAAHPPAASRPASAAAPLPPPYPPTLTKWSSCGQQAVWDAVAAGLGPDGAPYPPLPPGLYDAGLRSPAPDHPAPRARPPSWPEGGVPYYCLANGHAFPRPVVREFVRTVLEEPRGGRMPLTVGMPPADDVAPPAFDVAAVNAAHRALAARRRRGVRTLLADRTAAARGAVRARRPGDAAPARLYHSYAGRPAL